MIQLLFIVCAGIAADTAAPKEPPSYRAELVFPLRHDHNHAPGIVACKNGDLLASWYRGSGERTADDVAVFGARLPNGQSKWTPEFLLADTPGFPDCNTAMLIDDTNRLWLFWPIVIANSWESCLTNYKSSVSFSAPGPPVWDRHGIILLKPDDFRERAEQLLDQLIAQLPESIVNQRKETIRETRERLAKKIYQRLGWQPRCKPTILRSGRILLPLYTDTFSISIMAVSDNGGESWYASKPLIGFGNIQPTVLQRKDGSVVAFMRENGPRQRIRVAESHDDGITWGPVGESSLPNPGSGLDGIRLSDDQWVLVYNDTTRGRNSLAISISDDDGKTWKWTRHLEHEPEGSYHYPAITEDNHGTIHVIYSYFVKDGKSMKHAAFNQSWVKQSTD